MFWMKRLAIGFLLVLTVSIAFLDDVSASADRALVSRPDPTTGYGSKNSAQTQQERSQFSVSSTPPHFPTSSKGRVKFIEVIIPKPSTPFDKILSFPKKYPFAFQLMLATTKTFAADLMTQCFAEGRHLSRVNWKRNTIFLLYGFGYLGCFQKWLFVDRYRKWFPTMDRFAQLSLKEKLQDKTGLLEAAKMMLFDVLIHIPLMAFPVLYVLKEFVEGNSWNPTLWIWDGFAKYSKNFLQDWATIITVWGPTDCIQFTLPVDARMPFRHILSFFWMAYMSYRRGAPTNS